MTKPAQREKDAGLHVHSPPVTTATSFVVDLDFAASGHPSFRDVKFTLHEQELVQNIQIGYFAQPFGLEAMTSGRDLLLLEPQSPFALVPFRQTGLGAYGTSDEQMIQWSVSGYRFPTNSFGVSQGEKRRLGHCHAGHRDPGVRWRHRSPAAFRSQLQFCKSGDK